ncbi:hypothetical protein PIB30_005888 [Stylosanthes scabra]|uniref:Uncharacterized protein n=1 Tax=Stylosanthes scabra TaxID=79078 RepID=A0ABU6Q450_9FABA|nr:hypothetical protein [Stylosanthes scabra]
MQNTQKQGLLSVANFSFHRAPIKISTVQNEEPDEANVLSKFQADPTKGPPPVSLAPPRLFCFHPPMSPETSTAAV